MYWDRRMYRGGPCLPFPPAIAPPVYGPRYGYYAPPRSFPCAPLITTATNRLGKCVELGACGFSCGGCGCGSSKACNLCGLCNLWFCACSVLFAIIVAVSIMYAHTFAPLECYNCAGPLEGECGTMIYPEIIPLVTCYKVCVSICSADKFVNRTCMKYEEFVGKKGIYCTTSKCNGFNDPCKVVPPVVDKKVATGVATKTKKDPVYHKKFPFFPVSRLPPPTPGGPVPPGDGQDETHRNGEEPRKEGEEGRRDPGPPQLPGPYDVPGPGPYDFPVPYPPGPYLPGPYIPGMYKPPPVFKELPPVPSKISVAPQDEEGNDATMAAEIESKDTMKAKIDESGGSGQITMAEIIEIGGTPGNKEKAKNRSKAASEKVGKLTRIKKVKNNMDDGGQETSKELTQGRKIGANEGRGPEWEESNNKGPDETES